MIGEVVRFVYNTFILDRAEYAKICREINTNYSKYEGKTYAVHISYGIDNKPYWYYFENHGYDNYNIYIYIYENRNVRGLSYGRIKKTAQQYR